FQYKGNIAKKNVVIFDDVLTTGNTLNELAKTLKHHGARTVSAWCIARAEF
nr:ComF family protein [Gammaproteobacteria bacterium]